MSRATTIKIGGGAEYAKVAERLRIFREACPNGLIETEIIPDGERVIFKARILKDKSDPNSAESTGHAVGSTTGTKAFEKQESIAIGRALAVLGYLASGEIASSDEMEQFHEWQDDQAKEHIEKIQSCKTMDELKVAWRAIGNTSNKKLVLAKD